MPLTEIIGAWLAALLTLSILSFLFKENPIYKAAEHLFVGISAGANVLASERWINENNPDGIVVTILCDRGERYFSILEEK